jgi:lysyl oxidase-like protein 2/3/4
MWSEITRYGLREKVVTALGTTVPEKAYFKRQGILETIEDEGALERLNELLQMFFSPDGLQMSDIIPRPYDNWFNEELFKKYDAITSEQRIASMDINDKEKDLLRTTVMHLGLCSSEHVGFGEAMHWHSLCGTDMETIEATMGRYKLGHGGTTVLARAIYDDFKGDSMFGAQVDHISQDENGASVELDTGKTFKAKYVICTVPLNVVKDVKFTPSLSSIRQEAVDIGHPGRGGKVHFMVSPALPAFNTSTTSPTELTFLFSDHNVPKTDTSYLVSFVHSDAESKDKLHDAEAMKAAFAQMRPDGAENLTSYAYHDWANDPYARGTWCCFEAGYATKYLKELQSQHGKRVIMASSDWAEGWRGCIDGAIEQGILAAREVKRVLL